MSFVLIQSNARADGFRIKEAIDFAKPYQPDAFLAVGRYFTLFLEYRRLTVTRRRFRHRHRQVNEPLYRIPTG